jgi:membrane-associated phospholipid phosphatase
MPDLIRLGAISCAGGVLSYGVMSLLGPTVLNHGPAIDEPILRWTASHQVNWWAAITERLGKVGNTWTTWGAAGTAAVCLGVSWRRQKWLPPTALGAAILVDHYATLALRHKFGRLGPPGSPGGTYPSGGCDRVVLFYGLIAHLLWREFGGSYRAKVWAIGAVAALSFNEAYSREYLSKHWFTDIITGLFYGAVLLGPFIAAVRLIAGRAGVTVDEQRPPLAGPMAA